MCISCWAVGCHLLFVGNLLVAPVGCVVVVAVVVVVVVVVAVVPGVVDVGGSSVALALDFALAVAFCCYPFSFLSVLVTCPCLSVLFHSCPLLFFLFLLVLSCSSAFLILSSFSFLSVLVLSCFFDYPLTDVLVLVFVMLVVLLTSCFCSVVWLGFSWEYKNKQNVKTNKQKE